MEHPLVEWVDWNEPTFTALRDEQQAEIAVRYSVVESSSSDGAPTWPVAPESIVGAVVIWVDGRAVACGALRDVSGTDDGRGGRHPAATGEIKRLYVIPGYRRRGLSRLVMAELEECSRSAGFRRLVLESGTQQPEAIGLYTALGYTQIEPYGEYAASPNARHLGKVL